MALEDPWKWTEILNTATVAWDIRQPVMLECWDFFTQHSEREIVDCIQHVDPDFIAIPLAHSLYNFGKRDINQDFARTECMKRWLLAAQDFLLGGQTILPGETLVKCLRTKFQ